MVFNSIKDVRIALELSLEQLSNKSGRKISSLSDMEKRELENKVSLENIDILSGVMGYELEYYYLNASSNNKYLTLKELRISLNISFRALSKLVGKSHSSLCEIESREKNRKITIQTLQKVSNALGYRLRYFYKPSKKVSSISHIRSIYLATHEIISDELKKKDKLNDITSEELKEYVLEVAKSIVKGDKTIKLYHPIKNLSERLLLRDYLDW